MQEARAGSWEVWLQDAQPSRDPHRVEEHSACLELRELQGNRFLSGAQAGRMRGLFAPSPQPLTNRSLLKEPEEPLG